MKMVKNGVLEKRKPGLNFLCFEERGVCFHVILEFPEF